MDTGTTLTYDELITIVVALDNEAAREHDAATMLRDLKWKVFSLAVKADQKELAS